MAEKNRTVLFVRELPWDSVFPISTRMIAGEFVKDGWTVIWISPPLMPWHYYRTDGPYRKQLIHQYRVGGIKYERGMVFSYTPRTWLPFSRHYPLDRPFLARWTWHCCAPQLKKVIKRAGMPYPDILWLSGYLTEGARRLFPDVPVVQHVTDYYRAYPSSAKTCAELEGENYHKADHIVVTAPSLKPAIIDDFDIPPEMITFISHGIIPERFDFENVVPDPIPEAPHPRLIMLGNLGKLAFNIVEHILENLKQGCLLALGPPNPTLHELASKYSNLRVEGPIPPEKVPTYLMHGDVGLVLFSKTMDEVVEHVNPMKMYEYAAAGIPLVSTPMPVYNHIGVPVLTGNTGDEIWSCIETALENVEEYHEVLKEFAKKNTWSMRYQEAMEVVEKAFSHHRSSKKAG